MKKSLLFSFAFLGALLASIVLNDQGVSAVSGACYYGAGTCSVPNVGACGTNDVLPGRNTSCGGTPALNGVNTKAEFINRIVNLSNNGGRVERGAKFIMRETTGTADPARFRALLEQSNVDIVAVNDSGSVSSWYDPGKNDFFYAAYPGGWSSRPVLKIRQNGSVKSVIEIWCGNMTGQHSEVTPANTTIRPNAELPYAGPYSPGQSVRAHTWVTKSGPDTRSNWTHVLWYDQNGDSANNDGTANVIDTISGGPTFYPDGSTEIRDQMRTIASGKTRICVRLNLSSPTDNVMGGNTSLAGDPATHCRAINSPPTDYPPTGTISVTPCTPSSSQHLISYGGFNDQNGATVGQVSTSATPTTNNVAGPTSSNGTVARTSTGVVTYYLHVRNTLPGGGAGSWVNVASATFNNAACPQTVAITPNANLLNGVGGVITGAVNPGMSVSAQTRVYNDGDVTTNSRWTRSFWYETNGNDTFNSGIDAPIAGSSTPLSGGPTNYSPLVYTSVADNPSTTIDGTRTRICVSLSLSSPATNPITNIVSNPAVTCRAIIANPNELTPVATLSVAVIEPGQPVTATAGVTCNPGISTSSSNYRRIFWYENGGNVSRFDDPSDELVSPAPNDESSPPVAAKTYCTASNPFAPWGPITIPTTGVTRVCTSLQLSNPSANATISGSGIAVDCANVATKYFFRTTHGDVNALGCLASCASTPGISAFNSGLGTSYRGSGSQVGVFSVDPITEFTSSSNPSAYTVASSNPRRLTFANDGAGYGGNFTQRYQIPDYWAGATTTANQTVGTSSANVITNGDVYVSGNSSVGSVGVGNVPGLRWVIAKNIYISGSLSVLDGIYIARENIYTCGTSSYTAVPLSQMAAQCATPLTVKGSLIAGGSVKLQRTAGSLSTTPAEVIEYNPFVWIQGVNPTSPLPTSTSGKLDFITTLPPIL